MLFRKSLGLLAGLALLPAPALAAIDTGDTAWVIVATAMVLLMTPGLAFFYAGMVRSKNVVSTLYQNIIAVAVIGLVWVGVGFSLAFSTGGSKYLGDTSMMLFNGVGLEPDGSSTIPHMLFALFQMMFAIITPALMTGAFAERVRFQAWLAISILWSLVVYSPVAHWVWGAGGWLLDQGVQDFAGGYVVHMTAGFSAITAAFLIGKRRDFGTAQKPYDAGMIALGTALLWFGWFGFNAGSALAANGIAVQAFANSFVASAAALVMWTAVDHKTDGKLTLVGGCIGAVAGLVAITPAAGYVDIQSALLIGLAAGFFCNHAAREVKARFGIDDTLDVFACHGLGGLIGVLAVGLLGDASINGASGVLKGGDKLLALQLTAAGIVATYSIFATAAIIKVVEYFMPIRVSDAEEKAGLDSTQHGENIHTH